MPSNSSSVAVPLSRHNPCYESAVAVLRGWTGAVPVSGAGFADGVFACACYVGALVRVCDT